MIYTFIDNGNHKTEDVYHFVCRNEGTVPLVNIPDFKGWTPLHYACSDNNLEFVQQLLDAGADRNAR